MTIQVLDRSDQYLMVKRPLDMPLILQAENSSYLGLLKKLGYLFSDSPGPPPTSSSKDKFQLLNPATPAQPLLYIIFTFPTSFSRPKIPSFLQWGPKYLLNDLVQNTREHSNLWEFTPKSVLHNIRSVCSLSEKQWHRLTPTCMIWINLSISSYFSIYSE